MPSVLDSAATILTGLQDPDSGDQIAVVTPASASSFGDPYAGRSSGFASPIGSFRSRSPSPLGLRLGSGPIASAGHRADLLLSIPQPIQQQQPYSMSAMASGSPQSIASGIPGATLRPIVHTEPEQNHLHVESTPSIVTPTSAYFTTTSSADGESSSPTSHDDHHQATASPAAATTLPPAAAAAATASSPLSHLSMLSGTSQPPSPSHGANKRLSFMSYSDLLTSTPSSTLPLSMLTTSASSIDPPPHLPSLTQVHYHHHPATPSATGSVRGFPIGGNGHGHGHGHAGPKHGARQDSLSVQDDVGGEWEREGFGKGLEERLEASIMPAVSPILLASPRT